MAQVSRATQASNVSTKLADNAAGDISAQDLREVVTDLEDSAMWYDEAPNVSSGTGAPASTPSAIGDVYSDTTNDVQYFATGTASSADWIEVLSADSTQTLTNKTIDGDNNTISNLAIGAEVDAALAADINIGDLGLIRNFTNDNAGAITIGTPVYLKADGDVDLADADAASTTTSTIGLVKDASIASAASGAICLFGIVGDFDTSGLTAGGLVYVATGAAGMLTDTQPTGSGAQIKPIGLCVESHATSGKVFVFPSGFTALPLSDGAALSDSNGNEILKFRVTSSSVNEVTITNSATGNAVKVSAEGDDTNIGLDLVPKGTGAIECSNGHRASIYIPAAAMISRTTTGAAANSTELATNDIMLETMDFDTAADEHVQFSFPMPKNWNASTVTAQAYWSHPTTTVNFGVTFGVQGVAFANDDALDTAFGTAVLIDDTGGTTDDLYVSPESTAITIAGTPAAEEMAYFQVYRDVSDANDDLAVDARLHGVRIFYDVIALTED